MEIKMQEVKSSQINAIGYDPGSNTLAIRFKGGTTYHYANVPADMFVNMLCAESIGNFFSTNIKNNPELYPYQKQVPSPAFYLRAHLVRQRAWSEQTFGPGERTVGIVDHIQKELAEILANPNDLSEWINVIILALDGAWRIGYSPDDIITALVAKQAKNEARTWPDWREAELGKAIEHVREEPVL